jgi:hypothetical protein
MNAKKHCHNYSLGPLPVRAVLLKDEAVIYEVYGDRVIGGPLKHFKYRGNWVRRLRDWARRNERIHVVNLMLIPRKGWRAMT